MKQCLRISFSMDIPENFLQNVIQKNARDLELEGTAQVVDSIHIKIVACGSKENVEEFLDILHKKRSQESMENFEIEPFLKEKDYRGVFRIIE